MGLTKLLVLPVFSLLIATCAFNAGESIERTEAVRKIAVETPIYPGFKEVDSSKISKSTGVTISFAYKSTASYDEIKRFYVETLGVRGWGVPEEKIRKRLFDGESRELIFHKGEYSIHIDHETDESYGWDYGVSFDWEPKK